jgi:threonylcarbamoyladenosine tRNA methylthiotransferase MtaB
VTPAFVEALRSLQKICPHFHLALQSGSDAVLSRMRRRYTLAEFLCACASLREAFPLAAITTDVMTGFPGETEEEFLKTCRAAEAAGFARMHVFPYSERAGTPAACLPGRVPGAVRGVRARMLIAQGKALQTAYLRSLLGSVQEVLLEEPDGEGRMCGYTPQYVRVSVPGGAPGEAPRVLLTAVKGETLVGERPGGDPAPGCLGEGCIGGGL